MTGWWECLLAAAPQAAVKTVHTEMGRIHLKVLSVLSVTAVIYIHVSVCVCGPPDACSGPPPLALPLEVSRIKQPNSSMCSSLLATRHIAAMQ